MEKGKVSTTTLWRYGKDNVLKICEDNNWMCENCGSEKNLTIHHKDRNGITAIKRGGEINNSIDNLSLLCRKCHGSEHFGDRKTISGWKWKDTSKRRFGTKIEQIWNFETKRFDVEVVSGGYK